ncbi:MAG: bifunctional oligoribonuclease/PAP phosphatase NrnA [Clostridiales bacterium]|nr:bifunctional oligoribonuclease/PAP phosphatase NrnA [Clostridiales bacterium]
MEKIDKLDKIASVLGEKKKIALICHINPDGDTVGSALALYTALNKLNKKADVFSSDELSPKLKYLPFSDRFNISREIKYDLAIAVDCGDKGRLGVMSEIFDAADTKMCIDHHKSNTLGSDYSYIDPSISSTAEIIYSVLKKINGLTFDRDIATLLYAGMLTDSGCFTYPATTAQTLKIAAELHACGIDAADIAYNIFKKKTKNAFELEHRVLSRTKFFAENRIGIAVFFLKDFEETGTGQEDTEGLVNSIQSIDSVTAAVAVTEIDALHYRVSIRTKEPADASDIAAVFGGGGHRLAAGCRVGGCLEDVLEKIVKAAKDRLD